MDTSRWKNRKKKNRRIRGVPYQETKAAAVFDPGGEEYHGAPRQDGESSSGSHGGGAWHFDLRLSHEAAARFLTCHIYTPLSRRSDTEKSGPVGPTR